MALPNTGFITQGFNYSSREERYLLIAAFQWSTTVIGVFCVAPTRSLIRNRWPSAETSPEDLMLHLDDDNHRHQMLKKAIAAVKNPVHLEAIRLHYGQGWPIQSTSRRRPSLTRVFRASPRKIRYGIEIGLEQMRAAIGIKVRRRS